MKFGDLAIFAKVGWDILENRLRYSYLAPVSILFRLQTGAFHENESHFAIEFRGSAIHFRGSTPPDARRATTDRLGSAQTRVSTGAPRAAALAAAPAAARSCAPARPALGVTMRATQVLRMTAWYRGHRQEGTTY
jgi:hypothetical protein